VTRREIAVTGANGFVGRALVNRLLADDVFGISGGVRSAAASLPSRVKHVVLGDLGGNPDFTGFLDGVEIIVHCAARVHVMDETALDPLASFRRINTEATLRLANKAVDAGVRRFVFLSSIKVHGERTENGLPFKSADRCHPLDPYGRSKFEAESQLTELAARTGLEVVIVRPVLIYGPGVKANLRSLMSWLNRGLPLPLGAVRNQRSLLAMDNLVDLLVTCINHPSAPGGIFLASDGEDLSTPELATKVSAALGRKARLVPVPTSMLKFGGWMLGRGGMVRRLVGSLQVDIEETHRILGWKPAVTVDDAIEAMVSDFLSNGGG